MKPSQLLSESQNKVFELNNQLEEMLLSEVADMASIAELPTDEKLHTADSFNMLITALSETVVLVEKYRSLHKKFKQTTGIKN